VRSGSTHGALHACMHFPRKRLEPGQASAALIDAFRTKQRASGHCTLSGVLVGVIPYRYPALPSE